MRRQPGPMAASVTGARARVVVRADYARVILEDDGA
jgi:hypothetical protein